MFVYFIETAKEINLFLDGTLYDPSS